MDPGQLAQDFHVDGALVALDFDGTLAPIVTDPEDSRPLPGVIETLADLARGGAQVAVITGRDVETVLRLGGLDAVPGLVVAGLYGAQHWSAGQLDTPPEPPSIEVLRRELPATLAGAGADPAVWIEDKGLSLVVHARRATEPAAALQAVYREVSALAEALGLEVHPGRDVLELRPPGYDKGSALLRLVEHAAPRQVLFAGDDLGDLPAFAAIRSLREGGMPAWSVGVDSAEVADLDVDVLVDGPAGMLALLGDLAGRVPGDGS